MKNNIEYAKKEGKKIPDICKYYDLGHDGNCNNADELCPHNCFRFPVGTGINAYR